MSAPRNRMLEWAVAKYPNAIMYKMDGFDNCIYGVGRCEYGYIKPSAPFLIYDRCKVISQLALDMSWDEAVEYHGFNQACLYAGRIGQWAFLDQLDTLEDPLDRLAVGWVHRVTKSEPMMAHLAIHKHLIPLKKKGLLIYRPASPSLKVREFRTFK